MMSNHRASIIAMIAVALVAAACGGSGSGATAEPTNTSLPPATAPTTTDGPGTADAPDRLQRLLDDARSGYGAPGYLALVEIDGGRWFGSSGAADLDGTPITPDTRFRIASITKPVVAAMVLGAVERGEVSLDDVAADLLPDVLRPEPPITVRMLLDHTSGVFDYGNEGDPFADIGLLTDPDLLAEAEELLGIVMAGGSGLASDRLIVALAETQNRYFEPGTGYHYSNPNYQLAGMVLEQATGRSLADLLEERVIAPLGLERTSLAPADPTSPEFRGYGTSVTDGSLVDITGDLLAFGNGGNGGILTTAGELLDIMQAILVARLVSEDLLVEMTRFTGQSGGAYGLGLERYQLSCGDYVGHSGGVNGTASIAVISPDGTDGAVIALNLRDGTDPRLLDLADRILCEGA